MLERSLSDCIILSCFRSKFADGSGEAAILGLNKLEESLRRGFEMGEFKLIEVVLEVYQ